MIWLHRQNPMSELAFRNYKGDKPRPKACFLLQILTKIWGMFYIPHPKRGVINLQPFDYGRGLWKYRKIRRLPL